ncbi:Arm DNA-binding domain-containing protein [Pelovirga terrestris]|uniref:DUF4102 domain-containing protein n=1 Tax=Pelovirga terrestris TaxID=2771352 RepID=A0A8J6QPQ7_9BACT|nr:Arm DNA-binding domain-containing protein [Pelovirga terrestris]MBD1401902.1 DUF4102 domain-containing protein [Pelovirga terrestris]
MPRVNLRQQFVDNPPLPTTAAKVTYFDTQLTGFMLEVTRTGSATYYLRYRDKAGRIRQVRLGRTTALNVDEARENARILKSKVLMGFDVQEHVEKIKQMPTFAEFVRDHYLPHAVVCPSKWS